MNERIKELALHAGAYIPGMLGKNAGHPAVGFQSTEAFEEFAELMLKECEVALRPMLRDMISRGQAVELIKEHFGIENDD